MSTATDLERSSKRRYLLDHPQRLGILPTTWFWKDRENRRVVAWVFGVVAFVTMVVVDLLGLHPLANAAILAVALVLAEGLLEKYIRRQAVKRRALAADVEVESLPVPEPDADRSPPALDPPTQPQPDRHP